MKSAEGERIQYVKIIDPVLAKGNVEEWLKPVEEVMIKSVKDVIDKSNLDYTKPGQERDKWVTLWSGQAVLAVSMMKWTSQAEEAMKKGGIAGLEVFNEKLNKQIEGIVHLVRTNISRLQRCTLEALIVLDVHAQEVIKQELIDKNIADPTDFNWLAQLRYYWEENDLWVKITNSTLSYNYEYLGNSGRLVITTLTDRCYRTLCGALYLNYGGAPEGPAGTGKTETVKDLSKALAR
jgi:dynein heavy chain